MPRADCRHASGPACAYQSCSYSLIGVTAFDVLRQFLEGLITEFDRANPIPASR